MTTPNKGGRPTKYKSLDKVMLRELGISLEMVEAMSPEEQAVLAQCLEEMAGTGTSVTAASLVQADYKWQPVSMQRFIEDPFYMGALELTWYPLVKSFLIDMFDNGRQPMFALYGGGIGTGKSHSVATIITYFLYRLTCFRNPHKFFGLSEGNNIYAAIYSINLDQAMDGIYGKVLNWIDRIPYFAAKAPRVKRINSSIKFSDCPVECIVASKLDHTIGKDIFACHPTGTLVRTERGDVPIESVVPGELVYTPAGLRRCDGALNTGMRLIFEVTLDDSSSICATANHRFLVKRASGDVWVKVDSLCAGDSLVGISRRLDRFSLRVTSISPKGEAICWDIVEVQGQHCYLTEAGLVSHNCAIDEASFFRASNGMTGEDVANAIYDSTLNRLNSRFMQSGGDVAGMIVLASSKTHKTSFFEKKVKELREHIGDGRARLFSYAQWEVKPAANYKGPRFRVEIGDRISPSRIIGDGDEPRPGCEVISVPVEFLHPFKQDIDKALRDLAGIATEGMMPLFRDRQPLLDCIDPALQHPFTRESISTSLTSDIGIDAYFRPDVMFRVIRSAYTLRLNPHAPRYVGFDLAVTGDCLGMAMCHISGFRSVERVRPDGTTYTDKAPVVVVDFMLQIKPPETSEIDLAKARAFILSLRDYGVEIVRIAMDTSNSRDMVQIFRKLGFDCNLCSVDRTDEQYLSLRQSFVEKRLHYYEYKPVIEELGRLERLMEVRKVDHPKDSSKDVADALCQAHWAAITDKRTLLPEVNYRDMVALNHKDTSVEHPTGKNVLWNVLDREAR